MNLPNKLTLLRVILVPFYVFFMLTDIVPFSPVIALAIFAARLRHRRAGRTHCPQQESCNHLRKVPRPLADKVLVVSALMCMVERGVIGSVPVIIIVAREFMVSGLRLVTANEGVVVAAGIWGKLKTAFTMVAQVVIMLGMCFSFEGRAAETAAVVYQILIWTATALTVISGAVYLKGYWKYIDSSK